MASGVVGSFVHHSLITIKSVMLYDFYCTQAQVSGTPPPPRLCNVVGLSRCGPFYSFFIHPVFVYAV